MYQLKITKNTERLALQHLNDVCDNVYYWSKRKGLDPRRSISGVGTSGKIAPFRTYSGGISLQF